MGGRNETLSIILAFLTIVVFMYAPHLLNPFSQIRAVWKIKRIQLIASWKCMEIMPREAQVLPDGKIGNCLLTGTQAILVCFVYLGRLDKGTPFTFTSKEDIPEAVTFTGTSRS